jgi:peroxiredoxin Q/BCP
MKRLQANDRAPEFATRDFLGAPVDLQSLRGRRVMLSFYRYASCPLCNLRMRDLIRSYDAWSTQGLSLVAVFQSPASSIATHVGRQDAPFPIVADPGMELYRSYCVEQRWTAMLTPSVLLNAARAMKAGMLPGRVEGPANRVPADFLICEDGVIDVAYYGTDVGDHLPLDQIERWLHAGSPQFNGAPA